MPEATDEPVAVIADQQIEEVPIGVLRPHPKNPRRGDVGVIAESLERHGFYGVIVVQRSTGHVLAGNHRLAAARQAGLETVPVAWLDVDDEEAERILLVDNRASDVAGYHDDVLASLLGSLQGTDLGLVGTGWTDSDLALLLTNIGASQSAHTDPDDVPVPPKESVSKLGDVWLLKGRAGVHRVVCGDATSAEDYDRALAGDRLAGAVVTDPPYGVAIGAKNRALNGIDRASPEVRSARVVTDLEGDQGIDEVEALWRSSFGTLCQVIPPGTPYYVFGPQGGDLGLLLLLLKEAGLSPRHILIWVKNRPSFSIGRLDYDYQHEPIVYGWKPGAAHPWHATETQQSVLMFDRPLRSPDHPTVKPVALLQRLIENSVSPGGMVLDPFGGSGSTLIACERSARVGRMMEIQPSYVDLIVRRYEEHTGAVPILEATGEAHSFIE